MPKLQMHPARGNAAAFTFLEVMVASAISLLVVVGTMGFLWSSSIGISGLTAQALCNERAGQTIEVLQRRARVAICVSNDASGNTLTLGFDDNPAVDSDGDGVLYNDRNHFERFQFIGVNGSTANASTNKLVYVPNISSSEVRSLVPAGVRNLPGYKIFTVTNGFMTIVRFGVVDKFGRDHFQSIDVKATAALFNRPKGTNVIGILPF